MRTIVWVMLALAAVGGTAHGSPLELFGYGGRSPGLAGTGVATAADFSAVYLNPAGLAQLSQKRLSVGGAFANFGLEIDGGDAGTGSMTGTLFGAAFPVPLGGALADRVGFGIGLFVPDEALVRARVPFPGEPVFALLEGRSHVIGIMGAAGVKLGERWSAGAGILALAALRGSIFIDTDGAGNFVSTTEQRVITDLAPVLGASYQASERLRLGLTLRGASVSDYEVVVENDLQDDLPLTLPTLVIAGAAQYDPATIAAEAAWRPAPGLELAGQLSYLRWSAYPAPTQNPIPTAPRRERPGFRDTLLPRVSAEYSRGAGSTLVSGRAGYAFVYSPAPEMDGRESLLDNHRHVIAAGAGIARPGASLPIHVDVWIQVHQLVARRHTKDPDAFAPEEELPFDTIRTGGRILVGGLVLGVDL